MLSRFSMPALIAIGVFAIPALARPGDTFTYQALVKQGGAPVNGTVNVTVGVWDALASGVELDTNTFLGHAITDGLLNVDLVFAPGTFDGSDRWLQIEINGAPLSPRQPVMPAPYAMFAGAVGNGALPSNYTSHVDFSNALNQYAGSGAGLTSLNAASIDWGTMSDARLSSNIPRLDSAPTFLATTVAVESASAASFTTRSSSSGAISFRNELDTPEGSISYSHAADVMVISNRAVLPAKEIYFEDDGTVLFPADVGIGTIFPSNLLTVDGDADFTGNVGVGATSPASALHVDGADGTSIQLGTNPHVLLTKDLAANKFRVQLAGGGYAGKVLQLGRDDGNHDIVMTGNVGIGTDAPTAKLHVDGAGDYGIRVQTTGASISAIEADNSLNANQGIGVHGAGGIIGVAGTADTGGAGDRRGLQGSAANGLGVNVGVYGSASGGFGTRYGVYSAGNAHVNGTLSKSGGAFRIDHPLDPENKELWHSFVESPDMMNIYNGNVTTDGDGYATVTMPEWFDALNRDFRYQLTVVEDDDSEAFVLAKVARKLNDGAFTIRTSDPWTEVSWQVTGVRQDPWAEAHRIPTEVEKREEQKGLYLSPEAYGLPRDRGVDGRRTPVEQAGGS